MNKLRLDTNKATWIFLPVIILVGAFLRIYNIGSESYWIDEITMIHVAGGSLDSILSEAMGHGRPPLYVTLAHFWMYLFGESEVATRSLSAIFGIGSILVTFAAANQLFGNRVGIISALLISISFFPIYHSQEFRYYSMFMFLSLLSFYFFIKLIKYRTLRSYILYSIFTVLLFYSHTVGGFVIFAQNLYLLLQPKLLKSIITPWVVCQFIVFMFIYPGFYMALLQAFERGGGPTWIPYPSTWLPFNTLMYYLSLPLSFTRYWHFTAIPITAYVIIRIGYNVLKRKRCLFNLSDKFSGCYNQLKSKASYILLVICWFTIPILMPYVLSFIIGPMYMHRYTIAALPAFLIIIAVVTVAIREIIPEYIIIASLLIIITPGLSYYYKNDLKEQWREAAEHVEKKSMEKDTILFVDVKRDWGRKAFDWYYGGSLPQCSLSRNLEYNEIQREFNNCTVNKDRFWLIIRDHAVSITPFYEFFIFSNKEKFQAIRQGDRRFHNISVMLYEFNK